MFILDSVTFRFLSVRRKVEYYNSQLKLGKSLTKISKELEVDRNTIRNQFKMDGYLFNRKTKQYELHFDCDEFGCLVSRFICDYETEEDIPIHIMMLYQDGSIHDGEIRVGLTEIEEYWNSKND